MRPTGTDLRKAILDEAVRMVRRDGVSGLTMRGLAQRLGYSPATLYLYFTDKDELLLEAARVGFACLEERVRSSMSESDPLAALRGVAVSYLEFARQDPAIHGLMFQGDARPLEQRREYFAALRELVGRGVDSGKLRGPDAQALSLVFACLLKGVQQLDASVNALGVPTDPHPAEQALETGLMLLQA